MAAISSQTELGLPDASGGVSSDDTNLHRALCPAFLCALRALCGVQSSSLLLGNLSL